LKNYVIIYYKQINKKEDKGMQELIGRIDAAPTEMVMAILAVALTIWGFIYLSNISNGRR
jgi:hypothetical protein